jgi:hypothetical protein
MLEVYAILRGMVISTLEWPYRLQSFKKEKTKGIILTKGFKVLKIVLVGSSAWCQTAVKNGNQALGKTC